MRQSVASHRVSQPPQAINPASLQRLLEKKKEFEAVAALERASALFVKRIEGLADDCEVMAGAGQVHGLVLEQWPNMFRILGHFLANRQQYVESDASLEDLASAPGERLVRIPLDEVKAGTS